MYYLKQRDFNSKEINSTSIKSTNFLFQLFSGLAGFLKKRGKDYIKCYIIFIVFNIQYIIHVNKFVIFVITTVVYFPLFKLIRKKVQVFIVYALLLEKHSAVLNKYLSVLRF